MIFLKKEVARYRNALDGIHGVKDQVLDDAQKASECDMSKHIKPEELEILKQDLRSLEKLDDVDIPRITEAIDELEGFSLKSLKNNLNDDNKKSQGQISLMKKNFEDLQKYIDLLNNKAGKVSDQIDALKEEFNSED